MVIFVVDNDKGTADLLLQLLQCIEPGSDIQIFRNGQACLDRIRNEKPDIIITDIQMPGISGLELIRKIRSHPDQPTAKTPIIACSCDKDLAQLALQAGADRFFIKPFKAIFQVTETARELTPAHSAYP